MRERLYDTKIVLEKKNLCQNKNSLDEPLQENLKYVFLIHAKEIETMVTLNVVTSYYSV